MSEQTAVIAEDEPHLRDELCETLAEVWPELVIKAKARDGSEACEALQRFAPDVLFLDIEMPGKTGLEVAQFANGRCHIVFVTAYDNYAVEAFDHAAVDYVMKPVTAEKSALIRRTIKELVEEVDPRHFWQIHRGTLINVNSIAGVMRDFGGHLRVRVKQRQETLAVSEPYMHLFRQI